MEGAGSEVRTQCVLPGCPHLWKPRCSRGAREVRDGLIRGCWGGCFSRGRAREDESHGAGALLGTPAGKEEFLPAASGTRSLRWPEDGDTVGKGQDRKREMFKKLKHRSICK